MSDANALQSGPPVSRRPLPQTPTGNLPNRTSTGSVRANGTKRPVITMVDARPMHEVGFRDSSSHQTAENRDRITAVPLRSPPVGKAPPEFRKSMPINVNQMMSTSPDLRRNRPLPALPKSQRLGASTPSAGDDTIEHAVKRQSNCDSSEPHSDAHARPAAVPDVISQASVANRDVDLLVDVAATHVTPANQQKPPGCRAPTIIRAPRHTSRAQSSYTSADSHVTAGADSGSQRHSVAGRVPGGVRVLPSDGLSSSSTGSNASLKHKPMPKPKPALKPKPGVTSPVTSAAPNSSVTMRASVASSASSSSSSGLTTNASVTSSAPSRSSVAARASLFESSLKFAQTLESGNTAQPVSSTQPFRHDHSVKTHHNTTTSDSASRKEPVRATYRPTIIRAAVGAKTTDSMPPPPPPRERQQADSLGATKRMSTSCMNVSSWHGTGMAMRSVEIDDDWQKAPMTSDRGGSEQQSSNHAPPPERRQPTVIRARVKSSVPAEPAVTSVDRTVTASAHQSADDTAVTARTRHQQPKPRPRSMHGSSMMSSALSMPHIAPFSYTAADPTLTTKRPFQQRHDSATSPPSPKQNEMTSAAVRAPSPQYETLSETAGSPPSQRLETPFLAAAVAAAEPVKKPAPPRPAEGPKKPPRPAEGPKRRSSSSSSSRQSVSSSALSPALPSRPGPGHPLYHYVAQGPHAVALFDYDAQQQDELSFKAGAVVELLRQTADEWFVGRCDQHEGMFPVSFVDVIEPLPAHLVNIVEKRQSLPRSVEPLPHRVDDVTGPRCLARFDYDTNEADDLQFAAGDVIQLLEHVSDDWLKGSLRGRVGMFPLSFVEILEDVPSAQQQQGTSDAPPLLPPLSTHPPPAPQSRMPTWDDDESTEVHICTALHEFQGQEGELSFTAGAGIHVISRIDDNWLFGSLNGAEGSFPANFIDCVPADLPLRSSTVDEASTASQESAIKSTPDEFCVAVYAFAGEAEGDLTLQVGDRVQVLEHVDDDWLRGAVADRQGVFPRAFVQMCSSDSTSPTSPVAPTTHTRSAVVLHDFAAQAEGDLDLQQGQVVQVLEQVDDDWLRGQIDHREGIFPASFVQINS